MLGADLCAEEGFGGLRPRGHCAGKQLPSQLLPNVRYLPPVVDTWSIWMNSIISCVRLDELLVQKCSKINRAGIGRGEIFDIIMLVD